MLFNSFVFIFLFLPVTLVLYYGLNHHRCYMAAKTILVLASLCFYAWFNPAYLPIILSSIAVNYAVGKGLSLNCTGVKRRILLTLGISFNLGMLGYFKYTDFFIENVNALFGTSFMLRHILLPLGISFFTFQQLAFLIDSYKRKEHLPRFIDYCNFVTFFPQLIAGPIVLSEEMLPQFEDEKNKRPIFENLFNGLCMFSLGLVKKVFIADSIAGFADVGFAYAGNGLTMGEAWLTSLSYTFQLYFDFSGYCDMALGIGTMFNIRLPKNFDTPYRALNFKDFWNRWHITLNRFLTQYLYIPLGGSRKGFGRTCLNIMIVFFVSGFWHGAGWTFIVWGLLHGFCMVVYRIWNRSGRELPDWIGWCITFFLVNLFWVVFRADSLSQAWIIIKSMLVNTRFALTETITSHLPSILPNKINMMILFAAMILGVVGPTAYKIAFESKLLRAKQLLTILCFSVGVLFVSRVVTFLYFNF